MIFENPDWMENDFRNPIFWIFYFQKHPPIWDILRVNFFFDISKSSPSLWRLGTRGLVRTLTLTLTLTSILKKQLGCKTNMGTKFLDFHSQRHHPFTLKWWAIFFQKDEFLYGVPLKPFACDVSDVTITSKVRWKSLCIFKKFRDPTKPIFRFKKCIFVISWPH